MPIANLDQIDQDLARKVLDEALRSGGDFADLFAELNWRTNLYLSDNRVERFVFGTTCGLGVRVVRGKTTGYAYADGFDEGDVLEAARTARAVAASDKSQTAQVGTQSLAPEEHPLAQPFRSAPDSTRVELVQRANEAAREVGPEISQVTVVYRDSSQLVKILNSAGREAEDERNLLEFYVLVVAERNGVRQEARRDVAGHFGLEIFDTITPEALAKEAAEAAIGLVGAAPAPSGTMPVVMENGAYDGGVLIHEAIGHALESDFIEKGSSVYADLLGQSVAAPAVSVVDDGTLQPHSGSFFVDDEGSPATRSVLIENGILRGYMCDLMGARRLGIEPSGNGRRESFRYPPIPRMSCTFIDQGESDPGDIVKSVDRGVYVKALGGGVGDLTGGGFVFKVNESYMIEKGKITTPLRGVTLAGEGVKVLKSIFAVGNDLEFAGGGRCGKVQAVPTAQGQPTLGIESILIGGSA